jgi:hypothetical protein
MYNSLFLVWFKKSVLIFFFSNVYVKYDNCNLQVHVLQFYAHNICIVYNIKEVDLKMFNF